MLNSVWCTLRKVFKGAIPRQKSSFGIELLWVQSQMSAFKEQLLGVGLTEKWLMKEGKVQIRIHVVRTRSTGISASAEQAADIAALQQKISAMVDRRSGQLGQKGGQSGAFSSKHVSGHLRKTALDSVCPCALCCGA